MSKDDLTFFVYDSVKEHVNFTTNNKELLSFGGMITKDSVAYDSFPHSSECFQIQQKGIPFFVSYYNDQTVKAGFDHKDISNSTVVVNNISDVLPKFPTNFVGQTVFVDGYGPGIIIESSNNKSKIYINDCGKEILLELRNDEFKILDQIFFKSILHGIVMKCPSSIFTKNIKEHYEVEMQTKIILEIAKIQKVKFEIDWPRMVELVDKNTSYEVIAFLKRNE